MRPRTLQSAAAAMGGVVVGGEDSVLVRGVTVDGRTAEPGSLFVALAGARADGHDHVGQAFAAGATAAVVRRGWAGAVSGSLVEVEDPALALLDLARDERSGLRATVIGVTGSTGKTCTKDFIAAVLRERLRVVASPASFNNEVGLPLTILRAAEETDALVCEMGSRGPGHIRLLCDVARPQVGVVTNVGLAHMELFGNPDVLRDAKAELPESLPEGGAAVLNADDPVVIRYGERTAARAVTFGTHRGADVRSEEISIDRRSGAATFDLVTPAGSTSVTLSVPGEHMVSNALAAAAVGWVLGVPTDETGRALCRARVTPGRMEFAETPDGLRIVNDAYNANPASMAAALRAARWMAGDGRCIAVLGHMAELGPIAAAEHERIGELVARLGIDGLIVVGRDARLIAAGAAREGVEQDRITLCDDIEEAAGAVRSLARPGDLILIKASRVARLERLAEALGSPSGVLNGAGA